MEEDSTCAIPWASGRWGPGVHRGGCQGGVGEIKDLSHVANVSFTNEHKSANADARTLIKIRGSPKWKSLAM